MRKRREIFSSVLRERGCKGKMAERRHQGEPSLLVQGNQPLIGIPFEENGQEVVRYFAREEEADQAVADQDVQDAMSLAGAWSHLDWDDMVETLDRIRHESKPTPPIEL
jgi:hypothetical protein